MMPYHTTPFFCTACIKMQIMICLILGVLILCFVGPKPTFEPYKSTTTIAFYTVFCGDNGNAANAVQAPPSKHHACFFYTNNPGTAKQAQQAGWTPKLLNWPISKDDIKVVVDVSAVQNLIDRFDSSKCIFLKEHPFLAPNVWNEYNEAIKQTRYARQAGQMHAYITKQLASGLSEDASHHYWTAFLVRNMKHPYTKRINELWYKHIVECGIECQISFFFIGQLFRDFIIPDVTNEVPVKYT